MLFSSSPAQRNRLVLRLKRILVGIPCIYSFFPKRYALRCVQYKKSLLSVYVGKKEALYNSFGINQRGYIL